MDFLFGKPEQVKQVPKFSGGQEQVLNQLLGGAQQQLPDVFSMLQGLISQDPEAMKAFEAPAMRQFQEEIIPTIAQRFTSQFGPGSQRSSGFTKALGSAGAGLAERLQAQRSGLGMQGIGQLQSLLGTGLTPQTQMFAQPGTSGFLGGLAPGIGQAIGQYGIGQFGQQSQPDLMDTLAKLAPFLV